MPKDSLKKYCSIHKFLELHDPELYELFDSVCMLSVLRPKFTNGITLLIPDAAYKKKIAATVYSDNPEQAVQMLQSIVIQDYLPTPSSWMSKRDDIPNALRQKVGVESASDGAVTLTCGATIKPNKSFVSFATRENIAVWNMSGEPIPLDAEPAAYRYARRARGQHQAHANSSGSAPESPTGARAASSGRKKKSTNGAFEGGYEDEAGARSKLAKHLEDKFEKSLAAAGAAPSRCYLKATTALLVWLAKERPAVFAAVQKYLDWCPIITFYLVLEPYANQPTLIDEGTFMDWMQQTSGKFSGGTAQAVEFYTKMMDKAAAATGGEAALRERMQTQRNLLASDVDLTKPVLPVKGLAAYGGRVFDAFKDEQRFILFKFILDIFETMDPRERRDTWVHNFLVHVRYIYKDPPSASDKAAAASSRALMCLNQEYQKLANARVWLCSAFQFVRTDAFLHVLIPSSAVNKAELGIIDVTPSNIASKSPINLSGKKYKLLQEAAVGTNTRGKFDFAAAARSVV